MKIDLHSHSTASDGSLTPTELVQRAAKCGVDVLALTDHDTVAGFHEAQAAGRALGVEVIPGIEFSVNYDGGTMHLLGYFIDVDAPAIKELVAWTVGHRNERNPKMVAQLAALGIPITMEEVRAVAGGDVIGRPHIARVLCAKGVSTSTDDAFARYLDRGRPGFVVSPKVLPSDAINAIHAAGGVAVLAHPYQLRCPGEATLRRVVESLVASGLDGIEVHYSRHDQARRDLYQRLATDYGLVISGGSDFHGTNKPEIELGTGCGDLNVPREILVPLREARGKHGHCC